MHSSITKNTVTTTAVRLQLYFIVLAACRMYLQQFVVLHLSSKSSTFSRNEVQRTYITTPIQLGLVRVFTF